MIMITWWKYNIRKKLAWKREKVGMITIGLKNIEAIYICGYGFNNMAIKPCKSKI